MQHFPLFRREIGDDPVKEERRLVEEPLGRLDSLDHHAAGQHVQPRVFLGRQLLAGEDHDRQIGRQLLIADALQHLEARHVRETQVEHGTVVGLFPQHPDGLRAGAHGRNLDIVVIQ